ELNCQLVERMGSGIKLTEAGENFLPHALEIMDAVRGASSAVDDSNPNALKGTLKIGIIPTIAPYFLPDMMEDLYPGEPELDIYVEEQQTDNLLNRLKMGEVDHLLLSPPIPDKGMTVEQVGSEPFYLAVSKEEPLADRNQISLDEINDEPILLLEEGHCLRDQSLSFCQQNNVTPNVVFQGSSLHSILNLVETGFGYTFVPDMVRKSQHRDSLEFIPFTEPQPKRDIILVRRSSTRMNKLDKRFRDLVKNWFK
ncbi:MAG: LysR substrate-binding domain-containing protein, partial [bacterium]